MELLVEVGYGGMSVEAVAARAQVGKATIYRRWPSKKELIAEALRGLSDDVRMPDTGNTRDDLIALFLDFRRVNSASYIGPMTGRIISAAISNPEFMTIYWENALLPDARRSWRSLSADRHEARSGWTLTCNWCSTSSRVRWCIACWCHDMDSTSRRRPTPAPRSWSTPSGAASPPMARQRQGAPLAASEAPVLRLPAANRSMMSHPGRRR